MTATYCDIYTEAPCPLCGRCAVLIDAICLDCMINQFGTPCPWLDSPAWLVIQGQEER